MIAETDELPLASGGRNGFPCRRTAMTTAVRVERTPGSRLIFHVTTCLTLSSDSDYVEYMMGHTITTYHDIQSKGVEFLRGLYGNANLTIRPKGSLTPREQLQAIARGFGLCPEEAARLLTSSEPHRAYASQEERKEHEVRVLCDAITERIKDKILASR